MKPVKGKTYQSIDWKLRDGGVADERLNVTANYVDGLLNTVSVHGGGLLGYTRTTIEPKDLKTLVETLQAIQPQYE